MNLKQSGIYSIYNAETKMTYIGSAFNLLVRKNKHFNLLRKGLHPNILMSNDFEKFGENSFEFSVLELCPKESILSREQEWIEKTQSAIFGYNISLHAGAPMTGRKHSEETRQKMKLAHRARKPISEETREKLRQAAKLREAEKKANGFEVSEETREKLRQASMGRPVSEDTRNKLRESNSRPLRTTAQKEAHRKNAESRIGKPISEQQKRVQSEKMKIRWQDPTYRENVRSGRGGS